MQNKKNYIEAPHEGRGKKGKKSYNYLRHRD